MASAISVDIVAAVIYAVAFMLSRSRPPPASEVAAIRKSGLGTTAAVLAPGATEATRLTIAAGHAQVIGARLTLANDDTGAVVTLDLRPGQP
ncbi:hypothetical protein EES39_31235 [Streptomyces sp. ADI92-24]|nr:hypothetical protein EES39_31235 [Streptomyces sp. ADI92-24]